MKNRKISCAVVACAALGAGSVNAWAEDAGDQAAPPQSNAMAAPQMIGPLQANPNPYSYDFGGPVGKVYVTGVASGFGQLQNNAYPGDPRHSQADISNAQVIVQKTDGLVQFYAQAGAYSLPDLGVSYIRASKVTDQFYGPLPVAYIKLAPTDSFSIQAGKLPTLIGAEVTFDFEDMNIERGLLWNQENAVNMGVQANYTQGPLALSFALTDGFYSGKYSWLVGSAAYTFNANNILTFIGGANTETDTTNTLVTPVLLNNEQIYNLMYTYTSGPWTLMPYLQYTYVPKNIQIGAAHDASTTAGAILTSYNFEPDFGLAGVSLPVRLEYISSSGSVADGAPNLMYGPGSNAWSVTVTPTYQRGIFFTRAELSYVGTSHTTPGAAFGSTGNDKSEIRGVFEGGVLF